MTPVTFKIHEQILLYVHHMNFYVTYLHVLQIHIIHSYFFVLPKLNILELLVSISMW